MADKTISYSIGAPVVIEIDADGKLTVWVDLAEANDIEFGYGNASLGGGEVEDDYDEATHERIAEALKRVEYAVSITV